jgi:hypothetical protein
MDSTAYPPENTENKGRREDFAKEGCFLQHKNKIQYAAAMVQKGSTCSLTMVVMVRRYFSQD